MPFIFGRNKGKKAPPPDPAKFRNCSICNWHGQCYRLRDHARRGIGRGSDNEWSPDYMRKITLCPNCWMAARDRGDFNQQQGFDPNRNAEAQQRLGELKQDLEGEVD